MTASAAIPLWNGAFSDDQPDDQPNVAQLPDEVPHLVPFLLDGQRNKACVLVCPGGGYWTRAPHEGEPVARWLNSLGIAAVVVHYRVRRRFPGSLRDAERAMRLVRHRANEWGIDPQRVGILGFSAGGHLAASACTLASDGDPQAADPLDRLSARPNLGIFCYPVITAYEGCHRGSIAMLLGEEPWDENQRRLVSLEHQVDAHTPPCFLWHTADDTGVPLRNSLAFAEACTRHNVGVGMHVAPHGKHGLGLAENDAEVGAWRQSCASWLHHRGFC